MNYKIIIHSILYSLSLIIGLSIHGFFFDTPSRNRHQVSHAQCSPENTNQVEPVIHHTIQNGVEFQVSQLGEEQAVGGNKKTQLAFKRQAYKLLIDKDNLLSQAKLNVIILQWAEQEFMGALSFTIDKSLTDSASTLFTLAGKNNNLLALTWLIENTEHTHSTAWLTTYFTALAQSNTRNALDIAESQLSDKNQVIAIKAIFTVLADNDIYAVFSWLDKNENNASHHTIYYDAISHYIEQAPWEASIEIGSMPASSEKDSLIAKLASRLSREDIYDAIDWAETLPNQQKQAAMARILNHWAEGDAPNAALDYLLNDKSLVRNQDSLNATIKTLANNDRTVLINRLGEFPDSAQPTVIQEIAREITSSGDMVEYETWFNSLPKGGQRAAASQPVVDALLYSDPAKAFTLAENIINPLQRSKHIEKVIRTWGAIDEAQARYAIMSTETLTDQQKSDIIERL